MSLPRTFLKSLRFTKRCLWDGKDLNYNGVRGNGKVRDFCELTCCRNYYVFKEKLIKLSEMDLDKKKLYLNQFVQYCMWRLINRNPANELDMKLKIVKSEGSVFIEMMQESITVTEMMSLLEIEVLRTF